MVQLYNCLSQVGTKHLQHCTFMFFIFITYDLKTKPNTKKPSNLIYFLGKKKHSILSPPPSYKGTCHTFYEKLLSNLIRSGFPNHHCFRKKMSSSHNSHFL